VILSRAKILTILFLFCGSAFAIDFQVGLDPSQESPAPTLGGATPSAMATVSVNTISGNVAVNGMFTGLTSNAQAAHLHGLAAPGSNAGVMFGMSTIDNATSGSFIGNGVLPSSDLMGLLSGNTYLNLHTSNNGPGEIRGQVVDADIRVYNVGLDVTQEVPAPNVGNATPVGSALVVVDTSTGEIEISGSYMGMTSGVVGSHLHGLAGPGATAGVIFGLTNTGGTDGTFSGMGTLSPAELSGLLDGNTYLNIHTDMNGPGEIRGQIVPEPNSMFLAILATFGVGFLRRKR
jgi:hypothetical protein